MSVIYYFYYFYNIIYLNFKLLIRPIIFITLFLDSDYNHFSLWLQSINMLPYVFVIWAPSYVVWLRSAWLALVFLGLIFWRREIDI